MESLVSDPAGHVYSPSELNREIKLHLEAGFPRLLIEGEVSNLSRPASGHLYFSLKDASAQVRCAMFCSAAERAGMQLQNGMKIVARGRISLYEARGDFQLIVDAVRDAGEGALQRAFEELKARLREEGLFDPGRKRPLPAYPLRIGIITSKSGAAIRDILHVLQRRWPVAAVRLYPAAVQGAEAPGELRAALAEANRERWAELLILGRGGGSLEDMQAFNDESLARAVAASTLPVVSAVGHETDFSICDFVADLRAPTPSAAAELVTPDGLVLGLKIDDGQMFDAMLQEVSVPLEPGDLIVFFTDGISETMNEAFDCYGENRLAKVLEQYAHLPFEQLRSFIFADLRSFSGAADQHDDMTMILLKVEDADVASAN